MRDELLGIVPEDYDVVTNAHPDAITSVFDRRFASQVGAHFGVVVVRIDRLMIEVATFRSDGEYSDARRPDSVTFGDEAPDAHRRDFTVNALFHDPFGKSGEGGTVIDYVGGYQDLQAGVLRAVGDPAKRLAEDHLRSLRAARLAAKLRFTIDAGTAAAILRHTAGLSGISRERIGDEVRRMIEHPARAVAMEHMRTLGLLAPSFAITPQQAARIDPLWTHCARLEEARKDSVLTSLLTSHLWPPPLRDDQGVSGEAWAALALDLQLDVRGFEECNITFDGLPHDTAARANAIAIAWRTALCISNEEQAALRQSLMILAQLEDSFMTLSESAQKRIAAREAFPAACMLLFARRPDYAAEVVHRLKQLCERFGGIRPTPLVSGDDLIADGFAPGPKFKLILESVYDRQLCGEITTRSEGIESARSMMSGRRL